MIEKPRDLFDEWHALPVAADSDDPRFVVRRAHEVDFPKVWDWRSFWEMTALLSIVLAIMNLLPIPALDGGHVMFLLYEIVSGRKPGDKFMEYAQIAGMLILLSLLLYANGNDVVQLFRK